MARQSGTFPEQQDMRNAVPPDAEDEQSVEELMQLRAKIDQELNQRLTQKLCLMLADVVGSTSFFQKYGDVEGRLLVQRHNDTLFPLITERKGKVVKTIGDGVMASFESAEQALACAIAIQRALWTTNQQGDEEESLQTKISLHYGNALVETNDVYGDLVNMSARLNDMAQADQILISQAVYSQVKAQKEFPILPVKTSGWKKGEQGVPVYEVVWRKQSEAADKPSPFRKFQGSHPRCFYCGLQEHPIANCPSKEFTSNARRLERLNYLPLHEILPHFQQQDLNKAPAQGEAEQHVFEAFYEISLPYQLRFLTMVWLATDDDWSAVERGQTVIGHSLAGTRLWMGYDCIRVGRYDQAKIFLLTASDNNPTDYKPFVALGFLAMEQGDAATAFQHWRKGIALAKTSLQAAYIHLLMYRLYEINGKIKQAHQELQRALSQDTYLFEARYRQIAMLVKEGRDERVLERLRKLIQEDPIFYLKAELDPAFAPMREKIHVCLAALANEAQKQAVQQTEKAVNDVSVLRAWYQKSEAEIVAIEQALNRLRTLMGSDTYAGYYTAAYEAKALSERVPKLLTRRREHLRHECTSQLSSLQEQLASLASVSRGGRGNPPPGRVAKLKDEVSGLQAKDYVSSPDQFWRVWKELQRLKTAVRQISPSSRRWKRQSKGANTVLTRVLAFGGGGGLAVVALLAAVFGYLQYVAGKPLTGTQWLVFLSFGAVGGFLLGSVAGWGMPRRNSS